MPIVNENNKMVWGLMVEPINEFLGTVSNLWNNPANWRLGVLPTANQIAIISANCVQNVNASIRSLIIGESISFNQNFSLTTGNIVNSGTFYYANTLNITDGSLSVWGNYIRTVNSFDVIFLTSNHLVIPNLDYWGLRLSGGNRSLGNNLVIKGYLIRSAGNLDLGAFNLTIEGADTAANFTPVIATSYNRYIVLGATQYSVGVFSAVNLPTGTVFEFRNGLYIVLTANTADFGESEVVFTINSLQYLNTNGAYRIPYIKIDSGVTLRHVTQNSSGAYVSTTKIIGVNSSSIFDCRFWFQFLGNVADLMPAGLLYTNQADNRFMYGANGSQSIRVPDDGGYRMLGLVTSGVKSLTGNTVCEHLYFDGTATLDLNGYNVAGFTKFTDNGVSVNRNLPSGSLDELNFNNPANITGIKTLTGNLSVNTLSWCALNQSITTGINLNGFSLTIAKVVFGRNATSTIPSGTYNDVEFSDVVSGNNGWIKIIAAATTVTVTGTLYIKVTGLSLNAFIIVGGTLNASNINYNQQGNQNVQGSGSGLIYTNLTLSGGGTKTLQGNVVVNGSYSRVVGTSINKNGFTIKDSLGNDLE
ncbi:hypothetical protein [Pedobacter sp. SL55]|uniref:hypothetical protein n=1 Tax=Pedobacter sp. SL55 TaxID=2995161 RepID=UPI002270CAFB|nr:hypothetical protein [Pedobacter sp. SL55]WAC40597.1 hypothetical protein OVA16_18830 [Pedobacter sp. SL55]